MENLKRLVCHSAFSPAEVKWDFEMDKSQLSAEIMELENSSQDSNRIDLYFIYSFDIDLPE